MDDIDLDDPAPITQKAVGPIRKYPNSGGLKRTANPEPGTPYFSGRVAVDEQWWDVRIYQQVDDDGTVRWVEFFDNDPREWVLKRNPNTHPKAPYFTCQGTLNGKRWNTCVFRNRDKNGGWMWVQTFEEVRP